MHGRKKRILSEAEKSVLTQKADAYTGIVSVIFERKRACDYSLDSLKLTEKMLKNNPDFYTLWNFRKEILINLYGESTGLCTDIPLNKIPSSVGKDICDAELRLSTEGIAKNCKSCE